MVRLHVVHHEIVDPRGIHNLGDIRKQFLSVMALYGIDEGHLFPHHEVRVVAHAVGKGPEPLEKVGGAVVHPYPENPRSDLPTSHMPPFRAAQRIPVFRLRLGKRRIDEDHGRPTYLLGMVPLCGRSCGLPDSADKA
jgi:hypothetical protein